jgi:predicted phosphate transport protein (TIGR00153 family)
MRFSLVPRDEKFFDLLDEHAQGVFKGITLFYEIVKTWNQGHPDIHELKNQEHESDMTTHEIMDKLNRSFITPIDREDIHMLAKQLDDVIDLANRTVVHMTLFNIQRASDELCELAKILLAASEVVMKAVASIRQLSRPQRLLDYCIEINRLENAGDRASEKAIANLFSHETNSLEVLKWKELYSTVENAIDTCEDIANTLESIVVKYG